MIAGVQAPLAPQPLDLRMPIKINSLIIIGSDPLALETAIAAGRAAFPIAAVTHLPNLEMAAERMWYPRREVLLLLRPAPEEVLQGLHSRDPRGLPRWPVVVFGMGLPQGRALVVAPDDWNTDGCAKILTSAVMLHELQCENERMRGDLRTLSRRFSHDLRAPLNCVSTAGEAIAKLPSQPSASQPAFAQILLGAVAEVSTLVERVSFILKATSDPQPGHNLAMKDVVWASLQKLETRIRKQGATVAQPESWPHVVGVASWLEVIWENLIGNSLIHGGKQPRIELGWVRDSNEYMFRVRDYGIGVAPGRRAQLFVPFNLLHELNAPRGLGLPIVNRLIELAGGRCFFEVPVGGGACFFFTLPASPIG
jgi:signal transduction histidine kinase